MRREDAARLGYDNAANWRALLRAHTDTFSRWLKIPPDDLVWYAAYHDEGHHLHVHMMIAASGAGKTAYFLYPNIEYACASGMSFLCSDTKGDLFRNYAGIAKDRYGYRVAVLDLRNPIRSDGFNFLSLVNRYMDDWRAEPSNLAARAKAEKYAKIISKTIINASGDSSAHGQNAFFYDAAEGLLTSVMSTVLSRSTVKRAVKGLEKVGRLQKQPRYRDNGSCSSNLFVLR